jgi:lipid-binding SYLF domain-containing protein
MNAFKSLLVATSLFLAAGVHAGGDKYDEAIANFKTSSKVASFFEKAYGYVIFPDVGKAGFIVGGEHGDGKVFEKGKQVGTASLTQVSVGAQAGAKEYAEVIFFETKADFEKFKAGDFQLSGNAEATAITLNASASAGTDASTASAGTEADTTAKYGHYQNGVAVFTVTKGGLMAGISVGGQKLKFKPNKT